MIQILMLMSALLLHTQEPQANRIIKNKMSVEWVTEKDYIHFELKAPTKGWLAIGFNQTNTLKGAYLIMACVTADSNSLEEHYIKQPGDYQAIVYESLTDYVQIISAHQNGSGTSIKFRLARKAASKYHKNLISNSEWHLIMAYSQSTDFQHHSIMRTNAKIKL